MRRGAKVIPRLFAAATSGMIVACITACAASDNAGGTTAATLVRGPVSVASQNSVSRGARVYWADTQIYNPYAYPVRVVAARVLSSTGLLLEGVRVKRAKQPFFTGREGDVSRFTPNWLWSRLDRLPVTLGAHQPITPVSLLRLKRGIEVGRAVGMEIVLAGHGKRTAVRLKRAALVCRSRCPQHDRDRAWEAASGIGS